MVVNKKISNNNKGFTLLEVLVAVIILTIISVPLLRAFATATFTNQRAKIEMKCTNAVENIAEEFRNTKVKDIIDKFNFNEVSDLAASTPSGDENRYAVTGSGIYTFEINNSATFDAELPEGYFAEVELNPTKYQNTNGLNMIDLSSVSADSCAIYTMETDDNGKSRVDEEEYAFWEQKSNEYIDGLSKSDEEKTNLKNKFNLEFFRKHLGREITYYVDYDKTVDVPVDKKKTGSGTTESGDETEEVDLVTVDIMIKYFLTKDTYAGDFPLKPENDNINNISFYGGLYSHIVKGTDHNASNYREEDRAILFDNINSKTKLDSMYLFFYPRYLAGSSGLGKDVINVINLHNVETNVFIVRMENNLDVEFNAKTSYIMGKRLKVNIESSNDDESKMSLRTNLHTGTPYQLSDSAVDNGELQFELKYTKNIVNPVSGASFSAGAVSNPDVIMNASNIDGKLLKMDASKIDNRIYSMKIKVYNRNSLNALGDYERVMYIDGSKLD